MNKLFLSLAIVSLVTSCGILKDEPKPKTIATVVTDEVSNITATGATVAGEVVTDGNAAVTERGVAYGTLMNPTIDGSKVAAGAGTGLFTAQLTGLTAGTTYHARAYAVNSKGVAYGADRSFNTGIAVPTLTTTAASSITAIAASTGGTISSDGGAAITARGVCWNTTGNPTTADTKTTAGTGTGSFTSSLTGLKSNVKIYIRAYATNSSGTSYGNQIELTTLKAVPATGLVGWWPFNGNANDESGNGNNGLILGPIAVANRFGAQNSAFEFDGADDYITAPINNIPKGNEARTFVCWFNYQTSVQPPIYNDQSILIFHGDPRQQCGGSYLFVTNDQRFFFGGGVGCGTHIPGGNGLLDSWHHVVVTFDGSLYIGYLDGVEVYRTQSGGLNTIDSGLLYFGQYNIESNPSQKYNLKGKLDDVAIFNRTLTAEEVLKIYNGTGF